jgi:hypothetical protein
VAFNWNINQSDVNVGRDSDHVLALSGFEITPCMIEADEDAVLRIVYGAGGNNSNRRIVVWTDLSNVAAGNTSSTYRISFLRTSNFVSESIVITPDRITAGVTEVTLTVPSRLLYSGGNTANVVYVALTTDEGLTGSTVAGGDNRYTTPENHRGGGESNEFSRFSTITLTMSAVEGNSNPRNCGNCSNLPCRCIVVIPPVCNDCGEVTCICPTETPCERCDEYTCKCCENCDEYPCICPERCPDCNNPVIYCDCVVNYTLFISGVNIIENAWIEIHNFDSVTHSTRGLVLENAELRWWFPAIVLRPGETLRVNASDNEITLVLKWAQANFSFDLGDTLRLVDSVSGEELASVELGL